MPQHATTGSPVRRPADAWHGFVAWHDVRPRATMSSPRGWIWAALIAASFFWMSNPLVFVRVFDDSLGKTIMWTALATLVTLPWLRLPRVPWPWVAFLVLCALSQLWTINDTATDAAIVLYLTITALAVLVAANCEPEVVCWGLGFGGVAVVALSIYAFEKTMWGSSYTALEGVIFTGVGTNQNILAYTVAISLAATLAIGWPRHVAARAAWLVVFALNLYGIRLANSSTGYLSALSVFVAAAVIVAWPWVRLKGRFHVWLSALGVGGFLLAAAVGVVTVLGDQFSTFSGRAPFWRASVDATLQEAPLLGSGWGAVWAHPWALAPDNGVARDIYARAGYPLPHGHNFFVDVLPELGLLGVAAALVMVGYAVREVRRSGLRDGAAEPVAGRLVMLTLVALMVFGITEPMLTVPLGWWSLAMVVALSRQPVGVDVRSNRGQRVGSRIPVNPG